MVFLDVIFLYVDHWPNGWSRMKYPTHIELVATAWLWLKVGSQYRRMALRCVVLNFTSSENIELLQNFLSGTGTQREETQE